MTEQTLSGTMQRWPKSIRDIQPDELTLAECEALMAVWVMGYIDGHRCVDDKYWTKTGPFGGAINGPLRSDYHPLTDRNDLYETVRAFYNIFHPSEITSSFGQLLQSIVVVADAGDLGRIILAGMPAVCKAMLDARAESEGA